MSDGQPLLPDSEEPEALHERAIDNIRYIRDTMESAAGFTAVPGLAQIAIGATGLVACWLASRRSTPEGWIGVWGAEALVAVTLSVIGIARKSRAKGLPLGAAPTRKFAVGFTPPLVAGALL